MKLNYPKPIRFPLWAIFKKQRNGQRYNLSDNGVYCTLTDSDILPHINHLEMTGFEMSTIISYKIRRDRTLDLYRFCVFPQIRVIPNDTRGGLTYKFHGVDISIKNAPKDKVNKISYDGFLSIESETNGIHICRKFSPGYDKKALIEEIIIENRSSANRQINVNNKHKKHKFSSCFMVNDEEQVMLTNVFHNGKELRNTTDLHISSGEKCRILAVYSAEPVTIQDAENQIIGRQKFLATVNGCMQIETPDEIINRQIELCKIRLSESIFNTKNGLMHCPGGGGFYGAIWTNDQCEYANPIFAYLGYEIGSKQAENSFRLFSKYADEKKAIPTSIIACGDDTWNGAGDRGDSSMFLYGLCRYLLSTGDKELTERFLPSIIKASEYVISNITDDDIVKSDSDELENRFESGKANLSTSCITYDAFISLHYLFTELGDNAQAERFLSLAKRLEHGIEKYFGANVEGYDTYRYCEEEKNLRSWICLPMTMGINTRKDETVRALLSDKLLKNGAMLTRSGEKTYWDRSTLYALRGLFCAGETKKALSLLEVYTKERLLGEHPPYPVEAFPEGNAAQLSAESALYLRIFTEGILGYRPTGFNSFTVKPNLPEKWNNINISNINLCGKRLNISVERNADGHLVKIGEQSINVPFGESFTYKFEENC
ncbi:MAG: hypothetical protein ACI4IK_04580 [Eubacterium sp.]